MAIRLLGLFRNVFLFLILIGFSAPLCAQRPYVASSFPRAFAKKLECNTFVSANLIFPSEGKMLDPVTFNPNTVRIYPKGEPENAIWTSLSFNPQWKYLTLEPQEVLVPNTTYVFEVTDKLVDDRGFAFLPFKLEFMTGDCGEKKEEIASIDRGAAEEDPEEVAKIDTLPPAPNVALSDFYLAQTGDTILLQWTTDKEFMNADFTIDRSHDRKDFDIMDRIPSVGDSDDPQYYEWQDFKPEWGWNYYRLTLSDVYGELSHSDTIHVFRKMIKYLATEVEQEGILPIEFVVPEKTSMALVLKSPSGQIVKRKAAAVPPGQNVVQIQLQSVPPGKYTAILRTADEMLVEEISIY